MIDTKVYEPWVPALLGTASHFCAVVVPRSITISSTLGNGAESVASTIVWSLSNSFVFCFCFGFGFGCFWGGSHRLRRDLPAAQPAIGDAPKSTLELAPKSQQRDWHCNAEQPAPAPHLAHPEGCAALRIVLVTVPCVRGHTQVNSRTRLQTSTRLQKSTTSTEISHSLTHIMCILISFRKSTPPNARFQVGVKPFKSVSGYAFHFWRNLEFRAKFFKSWHFEPWSLNPEPWTPNPQPSTLNPQPSTLHPPPSTLNPQPSTLNPQPSTLNLLLLHFSPA